MTWIQKWKSDAENKLVKAAALLRLENADGKAPYERQASGRDRYQCENRNQREEYIWKKKSEK